MVARSPARGLFAVLALLVAADARAGNVNYNFNSADGGWTVSSDSLTPPEKPWTWVEGPSVNEGGWQAWRGADAFQSGSYLVSPLLVVDNVDGSYVRMDIRHRFDFGGTGTTPLVALGQVQYQVNSGGWLGIRTLDFGTTSGKIAPAYPNPPYPFIDQTLAPPPGPSAVDAWNGTTLDFPTGFHIDSQFELTFQPDGPYTFGPGDFIQFRFLVGTQTPLSGTGSPVIDWEINKVQIDGVNPVPEPAALALAGLGLWGLLIVRRRRSIAARAVLGSTMATVVIAAAIAWALAAAPARAQSTSWNFQVNDGGWISSGTRTGVPASSAYQWQWLTSSTVTGGTAAHWHVIAQGVSASTPSVSLLTSPVFSSGSAPAQGARISFAHDFLFRTGTNGVPITTGQLQYRLSGTGAWVGLPLSAFSGTSVFTDDAVFGASPFRSGTNLRFVDQSAFVAPNYLTPTGTAALPYLAPGAMAFTGATPGWPTAYVPTQAFLTGSTGLQTAITSMQVRFANVNLGRDCQPDDGWNIRYVQVDFDYGTIPPVPEPAAVALGATAVATIAVTGRLRRRRHHRPSRPSVSP